MKTTKQVFSLLLVVLLSFSIITTASASGALEGEDLSLNVEYYEDFALYADDDNAECSQETENEAEVFAYDTVLPISRLQMDMHVTYITGKNTGLFDPSGSLTRAQAAHIFYSLLEEKYEGVALFSKFVDVPDVSWYTEQVNVLSAMGVINGYGSFFKPSKTITRAEFVTILSKFFPMDNGENNFKDVPKGSWMEASVINATEKGWVKGYAGNLFMPNKMITRAEAIVIINRALGRSVDPVLIDTEDFMIFPDVKSSHWAYRDIIEASVKHYHNVRDDATEEWYYYERPSTSLKAGRYYVDGNLYQVKSDGTFAQNEMIDGFMYGNDYKFTSGDTELDELVKTAIERVYVEGMSEYEILRAFYDYAVEEFSYRQQKGLSVGETGWETSYAIETLRSNKGNCYGYAAAVAVVARQLGYEACGISGMSFNTEHWTPHGWTEVVVDGHVYVCDSEMEGVYAPRKGYDWDLFMKEYGDSPLTYVKSEWFA